MNYRNFYVNLMEAFGDDQKKKWLKDNPELTSDQIDIYIKWFDELRKSKPAAARTINIDGVPKGEDRFDISKYSDWHSFESFVDAVRAQTQLKGEKLSDNLEVIDGKPLFEKNGLEVYYADTPRACIKYKGSVPYGWCVSRADSSNMFYSYRLRGNNPAFYFVKDVEATQKELSSDEKFSGKFSNPWHFFVIQVLKTANINDLTDKSYVVTSANNDGDKPMSWNEIVNIQPKLNGLQDEFLPKPLSDEETAIINKYRNGLTFNEFVRLSYNEKERFLDVYPTIGRPITDEIFNALPYELKNKYIGMSIGLSDEQYKSIQSDKNLLKRYVQMVEKKFEVSLKRSNFELVNSEIDVLSKYGILENHINQLTDNNLNNLLWDSPDRQQMIDTLFDKNVPLTDENVKILLQYSPDRQKTVDALLNKNVPLTDLNVLNLLSFSPNRQQTIDTLLNKNVPLTDDTVLTLLRYSTDKQKTVDALLNRNVPLTYSNTVESLLKHSTDRQKTVDALLNKNVPLTDRNVLNLLSFSPNRQQMIDTLLNKNVPLTDRNVLNLLSFSPNRQQMIDTLFDKNVELTDDIVGTLISYSPNVQKTIDILLRKNVPLTDRNMPKLVGYSKNKKQTLDILLNRDIELTVGNVMFLSKYSKLFDYLSNKNVPLTDGTVYNLLKYSPKKQQMIDFLLNKGLSIDKILTSDNVGWLLSDSPNRRKLIALFLQNNIPLTGRNIENLLSYTISVRTRKKLIDFLFEKNIELTEYNVESLLKYSPDKQQMIDTLLNKNIPLTDRNVYNLIFFSPSRQRMIDTLLNKNVPLTDNNLLSLSRYLPNNPVGRELKQRIDALKLKQQLSETKFRYRDFYKDLLLELEFNVAPYPEHPHGFIGWKGKMVWMSPDKFLSLARKLDFPYEDSLESLRQAMKDGKSIPHLMLGVDMVKRKVVDHEGRHRATVAKELGIEKVPVFIYTGNYTRTPSWTEEDHDVVDNLKFDPEG